MNPSRDGAVARRVGVGAGIVSAPPDLLHFMPLIVAALLLALITAVALRARTAFTKTLCVGAAVMVAVAAYALWGQTAPQFGNAYGFLGGMEPSADRDAYIVTAAPGEPFVFTFEIVNNGLLRIRVIGLVQPEAAKFPVWRTASFHDYRDGNGMFRVEDSQPLTPFDLEPGETVQLFISGTAPNCALGSIDYRDRVATQRVWLAYSVLGLTSVTEIELPEPIVQPLKPDCVLA